MSDSISDLHRSIKAVVELSFRMVKLKSLGLSKGYRVEIYETAKQARSTLTGTFIRKYSAEIFPLYKSYAGQGGAGREAMVDNRQNVLSRPALAVNRDHGLRPITVDHQSSNAPAEHQQEHRLDRGMQFCLPDSESVTEPPGRFSRHLFYPGI